MRPPPLFGDRGRERRAARLAFVNVESHPLILAQMLLELGKHARDSQRTLFSKDAAIADQLVLPTL